MGRILVIEDQSDIRRLIRWALEDQAHELVEASTGPLGLAAAQAQRPDLVLLDWMMPGGMDGLEVCRAMRADVSLAGVKIVMLTARAAPADMRKGQEAGADEYLVKPFSPRLLVDTISSLLNPLVKVVAPELGP
jgi:DNA-binding response OmpR family regulator